MGLSTSPESSGGIWSAIKGSLGLFSDQNKAQGTVENQNPLPQDEYESTLDEKEIMDLVREWKKLYATYFTDIEKGQ